MNAHNPALLPAEVEAPRRDMADSAGRGVAPAELIDVRSIIAEIRRRFLLILVITCAAFGLACLALVSATPLYTATSQVVLERSRQQIVDVQSVTTDALPDSPTVDTEVQVLRSPDLAARVVDALRLTEDPEFNPELREPGGAQRLRTGLRNLVSPTAPATAVQQDERARQAAIEILRRRLTVKREGLSYAINIRYESPSPATAAKVANAIADEYLASQLEAKFNATQGASEWLNSRLAGLRRQVETAEAAVQQYRAANGLLDAGRDSTVTQQELSSLNTQLAAARADEAERVARLNTARAQLAGGSSGDDVGEALNSQVISQLRSQRAQASQLVAELESRYGPQHPQLQSAKQRVAETDQQIAAEIRRVISNLEAQAQVARQRTASIAASISGTRGTLASNDNASVRLAELERNAESVRTLYQSFLDRFKQTTAQQGIEQSDASIIKRATVPNAPSSPAANLYLAGGLLSGLALSAVLVLLLHLLENGLSTADQVERRLGVPALGSVPHLFSTLERKERIKAVQPTQYLITKPFSAFAEAFRALRTSVVYSKMTGDVQVVVVTSALPGEGKTTTALGLARTAALGGASVVMVDCDVRRRAVNKVLGNDGQPGLLELLSGSARLDDVLRRDEPTGTYWLPITGAQQTPRDIFDSAAMDQLLHDLRARFQLVVIDTAPVLPIAETRVLAAKADAVVLLARWRKTPIKAVEAALKSLESVGAYVAGVCLTQVDVREQARSGYGDPGYYYREYKPYFR